MYEAGGMTFIRIPFPVCISSTKVVEGKNIVGKISLSYVRKNPKNTLQYSPLFAFGCSPINWYR